MEVAPEQMLLQLLVGLSGEPNIAHQGRGAGDKDLGLPFHLLPHHLTAPL